MLVPTNPIAPLQAEVIYEGPIKAPIAKGDVLGELVITPEGLPEKRVPLIADSAVAPYGFVDRMMAAAEHLISRLNAGPAEEAS